MSRPDLESRLLSRQGEVTENALASLIQSRLAAMDMEEKQTFLRFLTHDLEPLDGDVQHLFRSWFNRGCLDLQPINLSSPAVIIEEIITYEAVHAIDNGGELRRRVRPADRRCFRFFHPAMPGGPLIFVEATLTKGIPNSVQSLLVDGRDAIMAENADTAVFYSISNCQDGLAGISFGNSAMVHALHAGTDTSENGMHQSNGAMVNYLYDLSLISKNHEQFLAAKTVVASQDVQRLNAFVTPAA